MRWSMVLIAGIFLSACGGGADSTAPARPAPTAPTTPPPIIGQLQPIQETSKVNVYGQTSALVGESVGFAITSKSGDIRATWQQTSGASVQMLADNSLGIGFDVPQAGQYTFVANVTASDGTIESITIDMSASNNQAVELNIRLDHGVTELGKVSLSADSASGKAISNISWQQLSGPQIAQLTEQDSMLFFDAPAVNQDAVIEMQASVQFSDGSTAVDTALIAIKNVNFDTNGLFYRNNFIITEDMHAYNPSSPYKAAIERCVYSNQIPSRPNCTFNTLPLIGSVTSNPSVQDILDRTLVSHDWMGDSFKYYLENSLAGVDMLRLLRGVTAVVISYDVRPSFYWAATGAIYLDANNFWQTPFERDTLNDQPDFRSDFGNDLNFSVFWRYTKNNDYYPKGRYPKGERQTRDFEDLEASISWLMYHELAHANDFFPPSSWQNISANTTPLDYFQSNGANSDVLDRLYPLRSSEMHALAEVSFGGQTPTTQQRNYRGTDIETFFTPDIAPSYYSYYTIREDFATLAERFFMLHRLGAEADVAIIDGQTSNDFNVIWGQRNRISEAALRERTAFAVSRVYPELGNIPALQEQLPPPRLMNPANGWFGNLDISPATNSNVAEQRTFDLKEQAWLDQKRPHDKAPSTAIQP
ncbi:hypothetical protein [Glaciecola sp. SC05]|uniref:hypothetical protein n=1 Tax=Glaciecola sp. SC05 TaxID=1987355 RepID=UPI0035286DAB